MRKFLFFILLLLLVCFGSLAASAAEEELQSVDVLDYTMPNGGATTQVVVNNNSVTYFEMPFHYGALYFDLIVESSDPISATYILNAAGVTSSSLTVSFLEGNSYRIYGDPGRRFGTSKLGVRFTTSASSSYSINFLKFDVYFLSGLGVGDLGEMNISPNDDLSVSTNYWYRQSAPGLAIVQDFYHFSESVQFLDYSVLFSSVNWRKYDYLDFTFRINAATINCISAYIRTSDDVYRYLPFEISFLNGTAIDKNEFVGSGTTTVIPASSQWDIVMRVYIPASYRLSGSLFIDVGGQYRIAGSRALLQSVKGYYYISTPDPSLVKLDQITAAIKESLSSSSEDNAAAQEFNNEMTSQKEQMQDNQAQIDSVVKPSADDLGALASPSITLDQSGMSYLTTIIRPITNNRLVLSILTLMATLALVSYVFFGKKR